jgi:hypothetical protein
LLHTKEFETLKQEEHRVERPSEIIKHPNKAERKDRKNKKILKSRDLDLKTRNKALQLMNANFSYRMIASILGIPFGSLSSIKRRARERNELKPPRGRPQIFQQKHLDFLERFLSNPKNCTTSLRQLRDVMNMRFKDDLEINSLDLIAKMVKKCGFSKKRSSKSPEYRNTEQNILKKELMVRTFLNHIAQGRKPIFIDETGFNTIMIPICGYSRLGHRFILKCPPQTPNTSVILAITDEEILGFQIIHGSVTAQDFGGFLCELLNMHQDIKANLQ